MISEFILTTTIFLPLIVAFLVLFLPKENERVMKLVGFAGTALTFLISLILYFGFDAAGSGFQFQQKIIWISSLNISYHIGIDGMSLLLILLTTFLTPLALLGTWNSIQKQIKNYTVMVLLLEVGMIGVFASLDLFLFYIFWEAMLIPMYFIIGIWGGQNRIYAAIKFFLYTLSGSLLMLVAIISLGYAASLVPGGQFTTDLPDLYRNGPSLPVNLQLWMFAAFGLSFAIKVPLWPLHTWLPDAHVEAPTAVSVILAGVLLKMGTYGIIRVCYQVLPGAAVWFAPMLAVFASINIIYGALCAMYQTDFKKLVAYSSVSHMGYVLLGLAAMTDIGFHGAVLQMFNHGMATGMLFLLVGVLYDRAHHRDINGFGGIASKVPIYTGFVTLAFFASMGLPGLANFISEALTLIGSFNADSLFSPSMITEMWFTGNNLFRICTILGALGVIITAAYLLWTFQRIFLGPLNEKYKDLLEINKREI